VFPLEGRRIFPLVFSSVLLPLAQRSCAGWEKVARPKAVTDEG
jgi:hypothetical protein